MEHPEKALFEEVKGLKVQMEEVRNRIFKVEATYLDKVENVEKREFKIAQVNQKYDDYKSKLADKKLIYVDGKVIPLFKATVINNIYKSDKLTKLFEDANTEVVIDLDFVYFNGILDILRKGHNLFELDEEDKNVNTKFSLISKNLEKDEVFINVIKAYFTEKVSFSRLIVDFNLNFKSVPEDLSNLIKNVSNNTTEMMNVDKYKVKTPEDFKELTNYKNKKAIFMDYNREVIIEFSESVRIKEFGLKPFTEDNNLFYPTTGSYYPNIYISDNGIEWDSLGVMPSNYGSPNDDYITTFSLGKFKTVRFIKVNTNSSSQLSISHIKI